MYGLYTNPSVHTHIYESTTNPEYEERDKKRKEEMKEMKGKKTKLKRETSSKTCLFISQTHQLSFIVLLIFFFVFVFSFPRSPESRLSFCSSIPLDVTIRNTTQKTEPQEEMVTHASTLLYSLSLTKGQRQERSSLLRMLAFF